jgi:uncharacterized protein (TIGR03435 family)
MKGCFADDNPQKIARVLGCRLMLRPALLIAACCVASSTLILAQVSTTPVQSASPTFDVASIKRSKSDLPGPIWGGSPGRWQMLNGPVASLIWTAYDTPVSELPGAPAWVHSDRYDVVATHDANAPRDATTKMLRSLLADRFKLAVHYEKRNWPVYALVVARPGRMGPELTPSTRDCSAKDSGCGMSLGSGVLRAVGQPLTIISSAGRPDGRVIVDKTGLTGRYDFTLRYTLQLRPNDDTPSIFTAVDEQLGLKLVPDTAPLDVVVVDRIERPTED